MRLVCVVNGICCVQASHGWNIKTICDFNQLAWRLFHETNPPVVDKPQTNPSEFRVHPVFFVSFQDTKYQANTKESGEWIRFYSGIRNLSKHHSGWLFWSSSGYNGFDVQSVENKCWKPYSSFFMLNTFFWSCRDSHPFAHKSIGPKIQIQQSRLNPVGNDWICVLSPVRLSEMTVMSNHILSLLMLKTYIKQPQWKMESFQRFNVSRRSTGSRRGNGQSPRSTVRMC